MSKPLNVAILAGGPSEERVISLKSAELIEKHLDKSRFKSWLILMNDDGWVNPESGAEVDLNDFSLKLDMGKVTFDFVYIIIHGTPAEDGKVQGYFEMMDIPHSTCDTLTSSVTFNKDFCKRFLQLYDIPMAQSVLVEKSEEYDLEGIHKLGLPLFVKPNQYGSSFGVSKVQQISALEDAIQLAGEFDHEILIEQFLDGIEYSCGVLRDQGEIIALPITQILPETEFFDYAAKYEGASKEITPAPIDRSLVEKCQTMSTLLYQVLKCRGMVRFDYILVDKVFYFLEANTTPGLSETSIIPQQALAYGWSIEQLFSTVLDDCYRQWKKHRL